MSCCSTSLSHEASIAAATALARELISASRFRGLNPPLTIPSQQSEARPFTEWSGRGGTDLEGCAMDFETLFAKTPATIEEIKTRVGYALQRHPLCRNVQFDIVSVPRTSRGGNWTISLQSVEPRALWEASDIVADIQAAYDLFAAA
jgi:hypothetical protein